MAGKPNAVTAMNTKLVTPTRAVFASADMVFNSSLLNSEPVQDRMNSYCGVVYRALSQKSSGTEVCERSEKPRSRLERSIARLRQGHFPDYL